DSREIREQTMSAVNERQQSEAFQKPMATLEYVRAHRPSIEQIIAAGGPRFPVKLVWNEKKQKLDKIPMIKKWQSTPPHTQADIRRAFAGKRWDAVGFPTGAISGYDGIDVDPRNGGDKWLREKQAQLPPTRTHTTQSGGWHILLHHAPGMQNSTEKIAPGV